ncbi:sugar-binding domain-containing protein [Ereboglobus luteus]|uniref:Glycosyl hydrolases family 2 sugar binding domain-containing protein n=1 Tax=Ereboglobus luteus TaxID=1796921 RepID=A0A2U8E0I1_9BACT|nr:sugar-binding domain-containing protein [Ereboglobus luteus]AWI08348.1 hypothetical protein CKA38_02910 [Ereboglobus luteus]
MINKTCFLCLLFFILQPWVHGAGLSLAGDWRVSLDDPYADTVGCKWRDVRLPGTLDDASIGEPLGLTPELNFRVLTRLQRKVNYVGPAWYSREVVIPDEWAGRSIILELERVLWKSTVFVDGRECGSQESLATPHRFDLGKVLTPGKHTVTLKIDNREIYSNVSHKIPRYQFPENMNVGHAYTNHTQIMWNGVLGGLRLYATDAVRIDGVSVATKGGALNVSIKLFSDNFSGRQNIKAVLRRRNDSGIIARYSHPIDIKPGSGNESISWSVPGHVKIERWDEFSPALYEIELGVENSKADPVRVTFGFRELTAQDGAFWLNGRRIFLRGTLNCAEFPLTGYPPRTRTLGGEL